MAQPKWKDGSRGMVTVCALFAGFSGVILINLIIHILGQSAKASNLYYGSVILAGLALWVFAHTAERITDALDEEKVTIYVETMLRYNVGVVLIFASVTCLLFAYGERALGCGSICLMVFPGGQHLFWLARKYADKAKMQAYLSELEQDVR